MMRMKTTKKSDGASSRQWPARLQPWRRPIYVAIFSTIGLALVAIGIIIASYLVITPYDKYVLGNNDSVAVAETGATVGIVLGAGITADGKPYRELQSRLDAAADAYDRGYVEKLVLSGDNRFVGYNEPQAMKRYLQDIKGIPADKLQEDFAGRSTYESCERAAKVFELDKAIIFSAGSHLPRAIFLCRQFGVESYGIASRAEANNAQRREVVARVKALLNAYVHGENTLLGEPIKL